jgi:hypothetical protein
MNETHIKKNESIHHRIIYRVINPQAISECVFFISLRFMIYV